MLFHFQGTIDIYSKYLQCDMTNIIRSITILICLHLEEKIVHKKPVGNHEATVWFQLF